MSCLPVDERLYGQTDQSILNKLKHNFITDEHYQLFYDGESQIDNTLYLKLDKLNFPENFSVH
jgi:RNA binding exosome subunit